MRARCQDPTSQKPRCQEPKTLRSGGFTRGTSSRNAPAMEAGAAAAQLLASGAPAAEVCAALRALLDGGAPAALAFGRAFGPRRLLKLVTSGRHVDETLQELADCVIELCNNADESVGGGLTGVAAVQAFDEVHQESMYPDTLVHLHRPLEGQDIPTPGVSMDPVLIWLTRSTDSVSEADARFVPAYACIGRPISDGKEESSAVLKLTTPSRRACFGARLVPIPS